MYQCARFILSSFSLLRHSPQVQCCPKSFGLAACCNVHCEVTVLMCSKHNISRKFCFIGKLKCRSSPRGFGITVCCGGLGSLSCQTGSVIQKIRDMLYLPFQSGRSQCQRTREQQNGSCSRAGVVAAQQ